MSSSGSSQVSKFGQILAGRIPEGASVPFILVLVVIFFGILNTVSQEVAAILIPDPWLSFVAQTVLFIIALVYFYWMANNFWLEVIRLSYEKARNEVRGERRQDPIETLQYKLDSIERSLRSTQNDYSMSRPSLRSSHELINDCLLFVHNIDPTYQPMNSLREYLSNDRSTNLGFASNKSYFAVLVGTYGILLDYLNGKDIESDRVGSIKTNGYELAPEKWREILSS